MITIKSSRAQKILDNPKFIKKEKTSQMKAYPGQEMKIWVELESENFNVKNLSFFGELSPFQVVIIESMASLLIGKPLTVLDSLTIRECEAFLRDRNSENAIEGMSEVHESELKKFFQWIKVMPRKMEAKEYQFSSEKGPFHRLKLVDKIKEVKAFLNSPEILTLYKDSPRPELVDMDDLTVYIQVSYESDKDKALFEELHILGVEAFQEENLNFIPDA